PIMPAMSTLALRTLPVALALLALGCPADPEPQETEGATESTSGSSSTSTSGLDGTSDGTGTTGEPAEVPARGVRVSLVELNAGVATAIGRDGAWVPGPERNAAIVGGRDTAFRIRVDVDEAGWVPRELEARLSLHPPQGEVEVFSAIETISGDSAAAEDSLDSTFMLTVPAASMVHLLRFEVELFEAAQTGWEDLPEPDPAAPRLPADGPDFVGVEADVMNMRLVLVPVQYDGPGCSATFDTSPEVLAQYEAAMLQHNPLQTLELEVHDPYPVNDLDLSDPNDFFALLTRMQQLRAQEQPDPNVYYYGIFDNCAQCIGFEGFGGCVLGVAAGLPDDSMESAVERVAIGASELDLPDMGGLLEVGVTTFVHEIGHTQGRQHVACPGVQAGGPDPAYPYAEGKIGVWGYGIFDQQIRTASEHSDYMSYCSPSWVSDWQWNATFSRIRTLSSWDAADMHTAEPSAVLVGAVDPMTGQATWWTDRGHVTAPREGYALRLRDGAEVLEQTEVQVSPWSEGPWLTVRAPLTAAFERATELELVAPTRTIRTPRRAVSVYHRPETLDRR
ncbi:MAG: hypothetical protein KDK70_08300, partial [Myxococcales bacterium]|nr:hypothetical protein [Myxococcales bacterium]